MGFWSGFDASPYKSHGNSILIKISDKKYIYVGQIIYSFNTDQAITDYISYMGNSDVPYPVAYSDDYVYFFLDKKIVPIAELETPITVAKAGDLYGEFYGFIGSKKNKLTKIDMKNVKLIHQFDK